MTPVSGWVAHVAATALARLADTSGGAAPSTQPAAGSGQGPEWGEAAPIGLLIILLMGAALFLLMKSMGRNLRRVPDSFDPPATDSTVPAATRTDPAVGGSPGESAEESGGATATETEGPEPPHEGAPTPGATTDDDRRAPAS
jgi:hypothetical protein